MTKSVCIVGAGPAGIIAAKSLLYNYPNGTFKVTVFEKSHRIGGLWPISAPDDGLVNPEMCTNLSRHTVSFSDMAWPESSTIFPKAWHVGQYLERYLEKYPGIDIRTSCKVLKTSRLPGTELPDQKRWKVEVQKIPKATSHTEISQSNTKIVSSPTNLEENPYEEANATSLKTYYFDYLIVASGFFGKPTLPAGFDNPEGSLLPIHYSTQFRRVEDLVKGAEDTTQNQGHKIVVIGGSMSGAEVAASIAMQLSSAVHSPGTSSIRSAEKYTVHHVMKRPFWSLPSFLPVTPVVESDEDHAEVFDPAPTFLPLDLLLYNLAKRPPGLIKNNSGCITPEGAARINEYLKSYVGANQGNLSPGGSLAIENEILNEAPWIIISNSYTEFVRSGQIIIHKGIAERLHVSSTKPTSLIISSKDQDQKTIDDIAAIVLATGFDATASLDYLPNDVLQILDYDPSCPPLPLSLSIHSTIHPSIPDLGFVGFYRGPFWGVMEMQSRFLGALWTGDPLATAALSSPSNHDIGGSIPELRKVYQDPKERKQLAQFPMGDYVYIMESFREILGMEISGEQRKGPVLPARYILPGTDGEAKQESMKAVSLASMTLQSSASNQKFIARAIFRTLQGSWNLSRTLKSKIPTYPSGKFTGTATFSPRHPTDKAFDAEYLYLEEGEFVTEQGLAFRANRRYAYRYTEATDTLSAWFIKPADNKSVDYLFHELGILAPLPLPPPPRNQRRPGWRATSHHLCVADTYDPEYEFRFRGASVEAWTLSYDVRGPEKDYRIESTYRR